MNTELNKILNSIAILGKGAPAVKEALETGLNQIRQMFEDQAVDWVQVGPNNGPPMLPEGDDSIEVLVTLYGETVTMALFEDGKFWASRGIEMGGVTHFAYKPKAAQS